MKTGHWKGCHGPERRLKQCACAEELSAHEWISQKTYKPPKRKEPVRDAQVISAFKLSGICTAGIPGTKAMVITIIVFFVPANEAKVGLFTDSAEKSNLRGSPRTEKLAFGTSQNEKLDF